MGGFDQSSTVIEATQIPTKQVVAATPAANSIDAADIYRRSAPGVVQITTTSRGATSTDVFGNSVPGQTQRALGSGFVIDKEGHVVTNYHVIQGASKIEVSFSNRETVSAKVVGTRPVDRPGGARGRRRREGADATVARESSINPVNASSGSVTAPRIDEASEDLLVARRYIAARMSFLPEKYR